MVGDSFVSQKESRLSCVKRPNKPDATNPAIASLFHAGSQRRGVADPRR